MENSASTRPDCLLVTTQGIKGGKCHTNKQGQVLLSVSKGYNEPCNEIRIDVFTGSGNQYAPREHALINIEFENGKIWTGTFQELKELIIK